MSNKKDMQIQAASELLDMRGKVIECTDLPSIAVLCRQANADVLFEYNSMKDEYILVSIFYLGGS